jgi:hypothetical protein
VTRYRRSPLGLNAFGRGVSWQGRKTHIMANPAEQPTRPNGAPGARTSADDVTVVLELSGIERRCCLRPFKVCKRK